MTDTHQLPLFTTSGQKSLGRHTPLVDVIEPFKHYLRSEGKAENTIKGFSSDVHLMCQFLGDDMPLSTITTANLNKFLDWLEHGREQPCSRKSYARRVTTIKVLFKWLHSEKILPENPAKTIIQRSGPAPLSPVVAPDDIYRLLDYVEDLRQDADKPDSRPALLVRLLLTTGIKKNETMNLTLDHINREAEPPILSVRYKGKRNVYKERRITLDADWLPILDEYVKQYKVKSKLFTCTARNLEYVLRDTAVGAGVEGKVSFEILRWTSAVRDYLNGVDMDELRKKMGLSEISWRETSKKIKQLAQQI